MNKELAFPQRLKPRCFCGTYGGTKAPPLQNRESRLFKTETCAPSKQRGPLIQSGESLPFKAGTCAEILRSRATLWVGW